MPKHKHMRDRSQESVEVEKNLVQLGLLLDSHRKAKEPASRKPLGSQTLDKGGF